MSRSIIAMVALLLIAACANDPGGTSGVGGSAAGSAGTGEAGTGGAAGVGGSSGLGGSGGSGAGEDAGESGGTGGDGGGSGTEPPACNPQTIVIRGSVDNQSFLRTYAINGRSVGAALSHHDLDYLGGTGDLTLMWGTQELTVGASTALMHADLILPFTDVDNPGTLFCGTTGTTTRLADRYVHRNVRLAEVVCPGTPVTGGVMATPSAVTGTVDGVVLDAATQWIVVAPGRLRLDSQYADIRLALDDPGTSAVSGNVLSGRIWSGWTYYCVGGGTFSRPNPNDDTSVSFTLTNISKVMPCDSLPESGRFDICVADTSQTSGP